MIDLLLVSTLIFLLTLPYTIQLGAVFYHAFNVWGTHWSEGRDPTQYGWAFNNGFEFRGDEFLTKENLDELPPHISEKFKRGQYALYEFDIFLMEHTHKFSNETSR